MSPKSSCLTDQAVAQCVDTAIRGRDRYQGNDGVGFGGLCREDANGLLAARWSNVSVEPEYVHLDASA